MKRIIVVLLFALILIPGANADTMIVIENHNGRSFEFSSIQYRLNPGEEENFTIDTRGFGLVTFQHNPGEVINVTSFKLSKIKIECLSIFEFPSFDETNQTTYFSLVDRVGKVMISGEAKMNYTYSLYLWENWIEQDFALLTTNTNNVSIITYLLLEFDFYFTYTVTKQVDQEREPDLITFVFSIVIIAGGVGAVGGFMYRPYYESCMKKGDGK